MKCAKNSNVFLTNLRQDNFVTKSITRYAKVDYIVHVLRVRVQIIHAYFSLKNRDVGQLCVRNNLLLTSSSRPQKSISVKVNGIKACSGH